MALSLGARNETDCKTIESDVGYFVSQRYPSFISPFRNKINMASLRISKRESNMITGRKLFGRNIFDFVLFAEYNEIWTEISVSIYCISHTKTSLVSTVFGHEPNLD